MLYIVDGNEAEFLYYFKNNSNLFLNKKLNTHFITSNEEVLTAASVYAPLSKSCILLLCSSNISVPKNIKNIHKKNIDVYLVFTFKLPSAWKMLTKEKKSSIALLTFKKDIIKKILSLSFLEKEAQEHLIKKCNNNPLLAELERSRFLLLHTFMYRDKLISLEEVYRISGDIKIDVALNTFINSLGKTKCLEYIDKLSESEVYALIGTHNKKSLPLFTMLLEKQSPLLANILITSDQALQKQNNKITAKSLFLFFAGWLVENNFVKGKLSDVKISVEKINKFYIDIGIL
jgi:hypothetical protein